MRDETDWTSSERWREDRNPAGLGIDSPPPYVDPNVQILATSIENIHAIILLPKGKWLVEVTEKGVIQSINYDLIARPVAEINEMIDNKESE